MTAQDIGLLVLRVGLAGGLFAGHGLSKLLHFSERAGRFPDPLGLGSELSLVLVIFAEVVCTLAVALGIYTRLAAAPVVIAMATALFIFHAGDPFGDRELAFVYLIGFLSVMMTGPGRISLDFKLRKKT